MISDTSTPVARLLDEPPPFERNGFAGADTHAVPLEPGGDR